MENQLPELNCRHAELSIISCLDDDKYSGGSAKLMDIAVNSIVKAYKTDLSEISKRMKSPPYYPDVWPGEHYRLISAIVEVVKPKQIIEIGTAEGLSALSFLSGLVSDAKLISFDIIPWDKYSNSVLSKKDFESGQFRQEIADLSDNQQFVKYQELIQETDLIFVDAPKDGIFEAKFLDLLSGVNFSSTPLVILDDIRLLNMVKLWRDIYIPKLDMTSFGHWSGTGLIDWRKPGGGAHLIILHLAIFFAVASFCYCHKWDSALICDYVIDVNREDSEILSVQQRI